MRIEERKEKEDGERTRRRSKTQEGEKRRREKKRKSRHVSIGTSPRRFVFVASCSSLRVTHLSQEPGDQVSKHDRLVRLWIIIRSRYTCQVPQIRLPFVQSRHHTTGIKEEDGWPSFNQPPSIEILYALRRHGSQCCAHLWRLGFRSFDLHRGRLVRQRTNQSVPLLVLCDSDWCLCLDDSVDCFGVTSIQCQKTISPRCSANETGNVTHYRRLRLPRGSCECGDGTSTLD